MRKRPSTKRASATKSKANGSRGRSTQNGFVSREIVLGIAKRIGLTLTIYNYKLVTQKLPASWKFRTHEKRPWLIREDKIFDVLKRVKAKSIVPTGYNTMPQIVREANELGLETREKSIDYAIESWLKEYEKNPDEWISKVNGVAWDYYDPRHRKFIPEEVKYKLFRYLKSLKIPKGYYSASWFIEKANKMGLSVIKDSVRRKIHALVASESKGRKGKPSAFLYKTLYGSQLIFNLKIKDELFRWLGALRGLKSFTDVGILTPVTDVAIEFTTDVSSIHQIPGLQTIKIGRQAVLDEVNVKYARDYMNEGSHEGVGKSSRLVPPGFKRTWLALDFWLLNRRLGEKKVGAMFGDPVGFRRILFERDRPWRNLNLNRALFATSNWRKKARSRKERQSIIRLEEYLKGPGKSELRAV